MNVNVNTFLGFLLAVFLILAILYLVGVRVNVDAIMLPVEV